MLSRNNSTASNLSAAAAAAALRRASSQKFEEELLSLQHQRPSSSQGIYPSSPRPGLRRRTSSMSERSFRAQAPEDHARERAASLMDVSIDTPDKPKHKSSFTIPISLLSNSQQKKAKGVSPGVIQPLPQQQQTQQPEQGQSIVVASNRDSLGTSAPTERRGSQHKFKTSMRDGAKDTRRDSAKNRERPMSPPTHSAMRLPQKSPGIGSAASSIRSFQTDLSSIAEDQPLDHNSQGHMNPKLPAHLFPIKSAMKAGSGPPSIISEAVSEESKSSLGAHDSRRGKARVSFSDEQEQANNAAAAPTNWSAKNGTKGDGFLKPAPPIVVGKPTERPASPPISPELAATIPSPPTEQMMTPPTTTQSATTTQSTVEESQPQHDDFRSMQEITPPENSIVPNDIIAKAENPILEPPKPISNDVSPNSQVTIHVSPTKPTTPKTHRLPGSFPSPTPDPTPPSTADSHHDPDIDAQERTDTLSPLRTNNLASEADLDLQRGLSLRTLALIPTSPRLSSGGDAYLAGEKTARRGSEESGGSEASVYSDAMDDLTKEEKEDKAVARQKQKQRNREAMVVNGSVAVAGTATAAALLASASIVSGGGGKVSSSKVASRKAPRAQSVAVAKAASPKTPRAQSMPPSRSQPMKTTTKTGTMSLSPGTIIPSGKPPTTQGRTTLRQNGPSPSTNPTTKPKPKPIKTSLRASSVPPTSPTSPLSPTVSPSARERKPMRMSLRANDRVAGATSADMARGLMSLPMVERVPSDSSFKRLKPRGQTTTRTTLRTPPQQETKPLRRRRDSDSSDEIFVPGVGGRRRSSSIFGRFGGGVVVRGRKGSVDTPVAVPMTSHVTAGSRFADSSDDEELAAPPRGIGRSYEDTESLPPSPGVRKRSSFSQLFRRGGRKDSLEAGVVGPTGAVADGRRRSSSGTIVSKRTGKEKRFQGLRKLFRIKE
jgi:hypothetical protein